MKPENALEIAKRRLGVGQIAKICGVSRQAVIKWLAQGHLPRTDWTGETAYAEKIAQSHAVLVALQPEIGETPITAAQLLALRPGRSAAARAPGAAHAAIQCGPLPV